MTIPMTIPELRQQLQQHVSECLAVVQADFDAYQRRAFIERPSEFFALELCGEAGELANIEKKRWRGSDIDYDHRADEAADVLISLMNFCNAAGIDLATAVARKIDRIRPSAVADE
ncbi:MAG: hypothetical protein ACO3E0_02515 [Candidatus Kapaibacteriota bacterium]|jgi:NTP pyrophosphatase (non-canonical NTP hydrolase)